MALDREAIARALFDRLAAIPGFTTTSRTFRPWGEVPPSEQPALFLVGSDEEPEVKDRGLPPVWRVRHKVFVYTSNEDSPSSPPGAVQNALLSAVEAALEAQPGEDASAFHTTLGGLVSRAYMVAPVAKDEGTEGLQGVAIFYVEYLQGA